MGAVKEGRTLLVTKIKDGTVIDHIPAGLALTVLRILGIKGDEGFRVAIVMNVDSTRMGRKDIVKLEGFYPKYEDITKIALVAPTATVNTIRDYEVVDKRSVSIPDVIEGILTCPNPTCITRKPMEPVRSKFKVVSRSPLRLRCVYCGAELDRDSIIRQLTSGA